MSSRVISGKAAKTATPIEWRRVQAEATPVWTAKSLPAPAAGPAGAPGRDAGLEGRIAELEKRIHQARQEGVREGEAAGLRKATEQMEPALQRFAKTIEELAAVRSRFRREAEQDLVRLSLAVAKRILRREMAVDPAALLGLVKAALDQLDLRETHRLRMHPQDAPAIEQRLRALGIPQRLEVVGDPALERGAAVFETSRGEMDASVDTQLAEISRGLTDLVERHR